MHSNILDFIWHPFLCFVWKTHSHDHCISKESKDAITWALYFKRIKRKMAKKNKQRWEGNLNVFSIHWDLHFTSHLGFIYRWVYFLCSTKHPMWDFSYYFEECTHYSLYSGMIVCFWIHHGWWMKIYLHLTWFYIK